MEHLDLSFDQALRALHSATTNSLVELGQQLEDWNKETRHWEETLERARNGGACEKVLDDFEEKLNKRRQNLWEVALSWSAYKLFYNVSVECREGTDIEESSRILQACSRRDTVQSALLLLDKEGLASQDTLDYLGNVLVDW